MSDATGCKLAFLSKTTSWCHKGKPKHDIPMSGRTWQGKVEVGSLVLGISVVALVGE